VVLCGLALFTLWYIISVGGIGYDAHAYWLAGRSAHPYQGAPGQYNAFLYSPVFVLLMRPLALMSWPWFMTVWLVAETGAFAWLVAPLRWRWRVPLLLVCIPEVAMGNIYGFLGVAAVAGMRRPEAWAFPLLTKVTPGGVGLLWFAARGEWSKVRRAVTFTLGLSAVSFVIAPGLWSEWVAFMVDHGGENGARVPVLLGVAALLTVVAARTNQGWLLAVAMMVAVPTFTGKNKDLAMLVAGPRLQRELSGATWPEAASPDTAGDREHLDARLEQPLH
jgi:glycosyl transferase family 87